MPKRAPEPAPALPARDRPLSPAIVQPGRVAAVHPASAGDRGPAPADLHQTGRARGPPSGARYSAPAEHDLRSRAARRICDWTDTGQGSGGPARGQGSPRPAAEPAMGHRHRGRRAGRRGRQHDRAGRDRRTPVARGPGRSRTEKSISPPVEVPALAPIADERRPPEPTLAAILATGAHRRPGERVRQPVRAPGVSTPAAARARLRARARGRVALSQPNGNVDGVASTESSGDPRAHDTGGEVSSSWRASTAIGQRSVGAAESRFRNRVERFWTDRSRCSNRR